MIARQRGEHTAHLRWRTQRPPPRDGAASRQELAEPDFQSDEPVLDEDQEWRLLPSAGRVGVGRLARLLIIGLICLRLARTLTRWLALLVVISVGYVAIGSIVHELTPGSALPTTPRAWLNAYEAATVDNPAKVCSQLLSPQLAATYARHAHSSCRAWFGRITASSVAVRRVLEQGATAVLELRQTLSHQNWSVVLDHRDGGWQAIDLLGS